MSVQEIQAKITELTPGERDELLEWLDQYHSEEWDRQIARDAKAGRFRPLVDQAKAQREAGQCKPL